MTDKMKQSLITELLFSDKPKLYSRNKWAEIAREGEQDENMNKPILLALAKCKYTPCDILQYSMGYVPEFLRYHYLCNKNDSTMVDSTRYVIISNITDNSIKFALKNFGYNVGQCNISDEFLDAILRRKGLCDDFDNLPYTCINQNMQKCINTIKSENFLNKIEGDEKAIAILASNKNLSDEYRNKLFDMGCDIEYIKNPTQYMNNEMFDSLLSRVIDFDDDYNTDKRDEWEDAYSILMDGIYENRFSSDEQKEIFEELYKNKKFIKRSEMAQVLAGKTESDDVLALIYNMAKSGFGVAEKTRIYYNIEHNDSIGNLTLDAMMKNADDIPPSKNMPLYFINALKGKQTLGKSAEKFFEYGYAKGYEKELAIAYVMHCGKGIFPNNTGVKFIKDYCEKNNIKGMECAYDAYELLKGSGLDTELQRIGVLILEKEINTADEVLNSDDDVAFDKNEKIKMRGKIVGKLRQQIDKGYFLYLPTGIIEQIRKECSEICNRNHKFKEYGSALMKYLDTFQKRQEYVTKYQFLFNIVGRGPIKYDDIAINLKMLTELSCKKTENNKLKEFIKDTEQLDDDVILHISENFKRDLNLLEMYDADYSVCLNGNCKKIIEYMLSNCIEIQERV